MVFMISLWLFRDSGWDLWFSLFFSNIPCEFVHDFCDFLFFLRINELGSSDTLLRATEAD